MGAGTDAGQGEEEEDREVPRSVNSSMQSSDNMGVSAGAAGASAQPGARSFSVVKSPEAAGRGLNNRKDTDAGIGVVIASKTGSTEDGGIALGGSLLSFGGPLLTSASPSVRGGDTRDDTDEVTGGVSLPGS